MTLQQDFAKARVALQNIAVLELPYDDARLAAISADIDAIDTFLTRIQAALTKPSAPSDVPVRQIGAAMLQRAQKGG